MDEKQTSAEINTSELIKEFLEQENMTPSQLADSLNVAETTVHRWLKGEAKPTGTAAAILWTLVGLGGTAIAATGLLRGSSLISRLFTSAAVGAGAITSGVGIYRLLKKKLERAEASGSLDEVLKREIDAFREKERQEQKVKSLREQLEQEERKLRALEDKLGKEV